MGWNWLNLISTWKFDHKRWHVILDQKGLEDVLHQIKYDDEKCVICLNSTKPTFFIESIQITNNVQINICCPQITFLDNDVIITLIEVTQFINFFWDFQSTQSLNILLHLKTKTIFQDFQTFQTSNFKDMNFPWQFYTSIFVKLSDSGFCCISIHFHVI